MKRAVFVVSKHPYAPTQDGETRVTRLLLDAAAASCEVRVIALSAEPRQVHSPVSLLAVPKPPVQLVPLAMSSITRRRSLIHLRYSTPALVDALREVPADVLVARRVYMAQAALDAGRVAPRDRLVVLVDVLESAVMRQQRSWLRPLVALESRRTRRDEVRCVQAASDVAFLSDTESKALAGVGPPSRRRLDLVLPPAEQPASLADPVAVFVGDRGWPPNAQALARLLALWPRILRSAPRARLRVIGRPGPGERTSTEKSVEILGFVDDLDAIWRGAAVLLAPVEIGGGVRVKVLDAARHGVPVVGSGPAIGSISSYLPLSPQTSDEAFVADAISLLADPARRRRRGHDLFEANRAVQLKGFVERQVAALLQPH